MTEERQTDRDPDRVQTRACEQRRKEPQRKWRLQPIEQYEKDLYDRLIERDAKTRMKVVREFESYLLEEVAPSADVSIHGIRDAVQRDVEGHRDDVLISNPSLGWETVERHLQNSLLCSVAEPSHRS
ncbi:hypothetical protein MUK72_19860 (plasmid) [Halococcus dombrowskii]|uniref:Uncharacterized protein n=1 Tax=Halococcus dombrowskii TaxID=179637 RepID=A0AAV3SMQ3_HALDO|nr:hypothetical protein [Halococcus dombrowskii]UOO97593.1 hypothetical protein MUK72_19860 [Halococcus dombrowskii]